MRVQVHPDQDGVDVADLCLAQGASSKEASFSTTLNEPLLNTFETEASGKFSGRPLGTTGMYLCVV